MIRLAATLFCVCAAHGQTAPAAFVPGAPQLSAGDIVADTALDPSGGVVASSVSYTLKPGYIGQLYDVVSLSVPPAPATVSEESTRQLNARAVMDDETLLDLEPDTVAWSVVSGPVSSITANDIALTASVYQNTPAIIQADAFGFSEELTFTVLDTLQDNFGPVAGDGIEDNWQFLFFDSDENQTLDETEIANAAPSANPDNDSSNNFIEWAGGFDPTDSQDFLNFEILTKQGNTARLRISKVKEGTIYSVQKSTDLEFDSSPDPIPVNSENFIGALSEFTPASDAADYIIEDQESTHARGFYRVLLGREP